MTNFQGVVNFLKQNRNNKFIKFRLNNSNLTTDDISSYTDFKKIKPITRREQSELTKNVKKFAEFFDT